LDQGDWHPPAPSWTPPPSAAGGPAAGGPAASGAATAGPAAARPDSEICTAFLIQALRADTAAWPAETRGKLARTLLTQLHPDKWMHTPQLRGIILELAQLASAMKDDEERAAGAQSRR